MEDKDIFEAQWEPENTAEEELAMVRRSLKIHDRKTIVKTLALLTALILLIAFVAVPLAETLYWNPEMCHYDESFSDLQFTLSAWMELFYPGKCVTGIHHNKTGFASYDLRISVQDPGREVREKIEATLELSDLYLEADFYESDPRDAVPFRQLYAYEQEAQLESLRSLPEYITIRAAVTFPKDLDMAQVFAFWEDYTWSDALYPLYLDWVAVRCRNPEEHQKDTGFSMLHYGPAEEGINAYYPEFRIESINPDGEHLSQHFKSLLQYSSDQWEKGRGIDVFTGFNYYQEALDYVEENGVQSYGLIVSGTPKALLHLMEEGIINQINILDAWLNIE